jgi:hypothetical protein
MSVIEKYENTVSDLKREISGLRRSFAELSERITLQSTVSPVSTATGTVAQQPPSVFDVIEASPPIQVATATPEHATGGQRTF